MNLIQATIFALSAIVILTLVGCSSGAITTTQDLPSQSVAPFCSQNEDITNRHILVDNLDQNEKRWEHEVRRLSKLVEDESQGKLSGHTGRGPLTAHFENELLKAQRQLNSLEWQGWYELNKFDEEVDNQLCLPN